MIQFSLDEFMVKRGGSVDPSRFVNETFELFSIPAFDTGIPEIVEGRNIGSSKKCIEPNDILLSKIVPHIRRCCVVPPKGKYRQIASGEWIQFRSDQLYSQYLKFFLISDTFHWQFMHTVSGVGGSLMRASPSLVAKIKVPVPPIAEQQKIASILDAADNLRQKDQQLIEKYTALSQSLFLEMFGDPVSNPMGWDKSIAENFIDLLTGFAFKSADYSSNKDDINLCGGLIITPSGIEWDKSNYWQRDRLDGLEKYRIIDGDIVMAMDRPWISSGFKIHKITKNDKESFLVQRTARIRGKGINQDFLYFLFKHNAFEKQANTTETTVPHISPKDIRKYELIIPPINLQNQFAERIQSIETQKQLALANLEKSAALFNSLLQRAFKGELTT